MTDHDQTVISLAHGNVGAKYWALATWDGRQWQVRIEDYDEIHRADTTATSLSEVGPTACTLLAAIFGCHPTTCACRSGLDSPRPSPPASEPPRASSPRPRHHVQSAVIGLRHANVPDNDITTILAARPLTAEAEQPRG